MTGSGFPGSVLVGLPTLQAPRLCHRSLCTSLTPYRRRGAYEVILWTTGSLLTSFCSSLVTESCYRA